MTSTLTDDIAHLGALVDRLIQHLRVLELQIAHYGEVVAPAHLIAEREDALLQLEAAQERLENLRQLPGSGHTPYLGLQTFDEDWADIFFGRTAVVNELVERARRSPFLVVLGASGSGKSSVVRAGLIPRLKSGALPGSEIWRYSIIKPGDRPLDTLAAELTRLQGGDVTTVLTLSRQLAESERGLLQAADLLLDRVHAQRLVLIVDQCEELWTLMPTTAEQRDAWIIQQQRPFIQLLLAAVASADSPLLVVLTLRADFLHRAAEHPSLARSIGDHILIVSPMVPAELREAIVEPARLRGARFEPGLVDELIVQVQGRSGALPLLEYTLLELWKRRDGAVLTWDAYRKIGGVEGALAARSDQILEERYTPQQRETLRQTLLRLVQPGEGAADTRRRVPLTDLASNANAIAEVQTLLKPLIDERLLTSGRDDQAQAETVEVTHEALLRAWPTLGKWISDARADLHFHLQLEEAAKEWQASGENAELLWSGLRLANAKVWYQRSHTRLNKREHGFLKASSLAEQTRRVTEEQARRERETLLEARAAAERSNTLRLRWFLALGSILLVVALAFAVFALNSWRSANRATVLAQEAADKEAQAHTIADAEATNARRATAREAEARNSAEYQSRAGEALFELSVKNPDQALLLARSSVPTDTSAYQLQVSRALRRTFEETVRCLPLRGHVDRVRAVGWSPNGQQILTGSGDRKAIIWDVMKQVQVRVLEGHNDSVNAVAWSPDGQQLLTGSEDKTARIWDATTGMELYVLEGHTGRVNTVAWSPDGRRVITGSADSQTFIWDATTGKPLSVLKGHVDSVNAAAWSPDGQQILTGSADGTVRIWDVETGIPTHVLNGHTDWIWTVAWHPDGRHVLSGGADRTVRIWNVETGIEERRLEGHTDWVNAAAWNPDGQQILTGSADGTARIWDGLTNRVLRSLEGHTDWVTALAWSPDGRMVLTGSGDNTVRIWFTAMEAVRRPLRGHQGAVTAVAWSPDGQKLLTGSSDETVRVWDSRTAAEIQHLKGHSDRIAAVAWSPDSNYVLTGSEDKTARIWDATTGQEIQKLSDHKGSVWAVAWSPDGRTVLTAGADEIAYIWDATTGARLYSLEGHKQWVNAVAWSPNGKYVATGGQDATIRIWEAATGLAIRSLDVHTGSVWAVAWSPDGEKILASSEPNNVGIWDLTMGRSVRSLSGHSDIVTAVAWSPDGQQVLTGSRDGTARVWNVLTGERVSTLEGHTGSVWAVAWSPDGQQVLTGSFDGTARIWIVDTHLLVAELTRRVCYLFTDDAIRTVIPSWRGCNAEMAKITTDLARYDALRELGN
jgi:WD40 repeat protein